MKNFNIYKTLKSNNRKNSLKNKYYKKSLKKTPNLQKTPLKKIINIIKSPLKKRRIYKKLP
ncbi:hypothetical protein DYQ05_12850 [Treponema pedis]|nr:hypothetical protein DYQ05_12850 [Treponema pedis]